MQEEGRVRRTAYDIRAMVIPDFALLREHMNRHAIQQIAELYEAESVAYSEALGARRQRMIALIGGVALTGVSDPPSADYAPHVFNPLTTYIPSAVIELETVPSYDEVAMYVYMRDPLNASMPTHILEQATTPLYDALV